MQGTFDMRLRCSPLEAMPALGSCVRFSSLGTSRLAPRLPQTPLSSLGDLAILYSHLIHATEWQRWEQFLGLEDTYFKCCYWIFLDKQKTPQNLTMSKMVSFFFLSLFLLSFFLPQAINKPLHYRVALTLIFLEHLFEMLSLWSQNLQTWPILN